jgi:magnesium transporter
VIVECAVYEEGRRRPEDVPLHDACEAGQEPGAFVWVDLYEPTPREFDALRGEFDLHQLAVEDALTAHERPKLERYEGMLFVVLKTARYFDAEEEVRFGEILVFVGDTFVITVRHGEGTELDALRAKLDGAPDALRGGTRVALHAIVDHVVDGYEPVVAGLQVDVNEVEATLFADRPGSDPTARIYKLGREVLQFSRAATPLLAPVRQLAGGGAAGVDDDLRAFFRDVEDHLVRVSQQVEGYRELLNNALQANLTQVTVRQNSDMRKISAWVAIIAVPTAIAGIYGMNFEHMPELKWELGYPAVLALIVAICVVLYWRFKRAGWL